MLLPAEQTRRVTVQTGVEHLGDGVVDWNGLSAIVAANAIAAATASSSACRFGSIRSNRSLARPRRP